MTDLKCSNLTMDQLIKTADISLMILKLRQAGTAHYVEKELGELAKGSNKDLAAALLQTSSAICLRINELELATGNAQEERNK